jgi:hypothetical protein
MADQKLHGADPTTVETEGYETPDEYGGQGDDRIVRVLRFIYTVEREDPSGATTIDTREAVAGDTVTLDQIGLIAQMKGEASHSFYTDEERELLESGQNPDQPPSSATGGDISSMGEYELAEYIKGANPDGKELTVGETVALAGDDPDLAHRILQAENIATDGEPRKGVEAGLTSIIESR